MINKEKIWKFVNITMIIIFVIGLILMLEKLFNQNYILKNRLIVNEAVILNTVRSYEFENTINTINISIKLNKCNGKDTLRLDSIRKNVIFMNRMIMLRDSLYIANRIKNLNEYNGF